jgi:hypothetical protein
VRSAVQNWMSTFLNSAIDAENISVSISPEKNRPVQNPIPIILVTIIVRVVWIICFFAGIAASTEQEEAAFLSWIISVKNVKIDKAMSNVKAQGSNKVQIPNFKSVLSG